MHFPYKVRLLPFVYQAKCFNICSTKYRLPIPESCQHRACKVPYLGAASAYDRKDLLGSPGHCGECDGYTSSLRISKPIGALQRGSSFRYHSPAVTSLSPGTPAQEVQRMTSMDQQQHLGDYCVDLVRISSASSFPSTTSSTINPNPPNLPEITVPATPPAYSVDSSPPPSPPSPKSSPTPPSTPPHQTSYSHPPPSAPNT